MEPHEQRVLEEFKQLSDRTEKLGIFLESQQFLKLSVDERVDLKYQWMLMMEYQNVLFARIARFRKG